MDGFHLDRAGDSVGWIFRSIDRGMRTCDDWFNDNGSMDTFIETSPTAWFRTPYPQLKELIWFFGVPNEEERRFRPDLRPLNHR